MDGYLVIARWLMDDAPLRLLANRKEAIDYISTVTEESARSISQIILRADIGSELISVGYVRFEDGIPEQVVIIRQFNDE